MNLTPPLKVLYHGLIGLTIFILILGVANLLKVYIDHPFYQFFVNTFNSALWIVITLSSLFIVADLFSVLNYPYNLPYPLINSFGYVYLVSFLFELLPLIEMVSQTEFPWKISTINAFIAISVFALTVSIGYIKVFKKRYKDPLQNQSKKRTHSS